MPRSSAVLALLRGFARLGSRHCVVMVGVPDGALMTDIDRSSAGAVRLNRRYDPSRLLDDLDALAGIEQIHQPGPFHSGGWHGVSLVSPGGRARWAAACLPIGELPAPTSALSSTPYLASLLTGLGSRVVSARLLELAPGARVETHTDGMIGLGTGLARLHVPIATNDDVVFVVAGVRYSLRTGELWYTDVSQPHSVTNFSRHNRIHLVVDAYVSPALVALIPPDFLLRCDAPYVAPPTEPGPPVFTPPPCRFAIPEMWRGFVQELRRWGRAARDGRRAADGTHDAEGSKEASVGFTEGVPLLYVDGLPFAVMEQGTDQAGSSAFRMLGLPPCLSLDVADSELRLLYKDWLLAKCPRL